MLDSIAAHRLVARRVENACHVRLRPPYIDADSVDEPIERMRLGG